MLPKKLNQLVLKLERFWYKKYKQYSVFEKFIFWMLLAPSVLYSMLIKFNFFNKKVTDKKHNFRVWVIGNITIGGNGKSIMVAWLAHYLTEKAQNVVILSRGYGRKSKCTQFVTTDSSPTVVGDEPLMLATQCSCPIIVTHSRSDGLRFIQKECQNTDIVLLDDGQQDSSIVADRIITVFNATRLFGNGCLLPQGPLREPVSVINSVDACVFMRHRNSVIQPNEFIDTFDINAFNIEILPTSLVSLHSSQALPLESIKDYFKYNTVKICTAIAHPERLYTMVSEFINIDEVIYLKDHAKITLSELGQNKNDIVIMTEKDAVKCRQFTGVDIWVLKIKPHIPSAFLSLVESWISY